MVASKVAPVPQNVGEQDRPSQGAGFVEAAEIEGDLPGRLGDGVGWVVPGVSALRDHDPDGSAG